MDEKLKENRINKLRAYLQSVVESESEVESEEEDGSEAILVTDASDAVIHTPHESIESKDSSE